MIIRCMEKPMNIRKAFLIVGAALLLGLVFIWGLSAFVKTDIILGFLGFAGAIVLAAFQYRAVKDKEIEALRDKLKDLTRVHHSTLTELRKQVGPP